MKVFVLVLSSLSVLLLAGCAEDAAGSGGGAGTANCNTFCAKGVECNAFTSVDSCLAECVPSAGEAQSISDECFSAVSAMYGCVGGLTCAQADAWNDETPPDSYPCKAQDDGVDAACSQ